MPVVKVKELPAYHHLLEAIWQRKFNVSLAADKNLIEHRKLLRQEIARTFGLYAGEFDSKRFEDVFNGVRNTEIHPENVLETSIPVSNYPGVELLEAYCHLYYQLGAPESPEAFRESARTGTHWGRYLDEYYRRHQVHVPAAEPAGPPRDFVVLGVNLCSLRAVTGAAFSLLAVLLLVGFGLYRLVLDGFFPPLAGAAAEPEPGQGGYFLSLSVASLIQSIIILALLVVYHYDEDLGGAHYIRGLPPGIVRTTLQQFQGGWVAIWISLLFLYLWFALKWNVESSLLARLGAAQADGREAVAAALAGTYRQFRALSWAVADFFNLVGAVLYFYLYFILDTESIDTESVSKTDEEQEGRPRNAFFVSIMKVILLLAVGLLAGSVVDRTVPLGDYQGLLTLLYSLFTSIAMAMFFGRLNSHFFNSSAAARVFFVPLFYLYAALQAVYALLSFKNVHISVSIISMVFVLKIILFFYINKLLNKRKFDGYITSMIGHLAGEKRR
ncbi:MAG: hypothetical protein ICV83_16105 [Cytophagales bacterium]|nr:hypothetical protein [Cytophagales bacterium]